MLLSRSAIVVMQGAAQAKYEALETGLGTPGMATVWVAEAFHFTRTRLAAPTPLVCTNPTCEPSPENTGEVRIWPLVL